MIPVKTIWVGFDPDHDGVVVVVNANTPGEQRFLMPHQMAEDVGPALYARGLGLPIGYSLDDVVQRERPQRLDG